MSAGLILEPEVSMLVLVDFQERLAAAMPEADLQRAERNAGLLLEAASRLKLPVFVTEQYPKGLGPTVHSLQTRLDALDPAPERIEKIEFDASSNADFAEVLGASGRSRVILAGLEAHICIFQTARGLAGRGFAVHVAGDATCSRLPENRRIAERLWRQAGAFVTCTETVLFDLLRVGRGEDFKALSKLLK